MTPRSPTAEDRNGILMPRSPLMEDDEKLVEKVAREIVDQHGTDAVQILRERADPAELNGDKLVAETWREIAEVANAFGGIAAAIHSEDRRRKRKAGFFSGPICSRDSSPLAGSAWASWCGGAESFEPYTG
jgi:hypothetical protein